MRTKKPFWHVSLNDGVYSITNNDGVCLYQTRLSADVFDFFQWCELRDVSRIEYVNVPIYMQHAISAYLPAILH